MFETHDGYRLALPRFRIRKMLRRLGIRSRRIRPAFRDDPMRPYAILTRNARRMGAVRDPSGRDFPVFRSRVGGREFRIFTRPGGGDGLDILFIRAVRSGPPGPRPL